MPAAAESTSGLLNTPLAASPRIWASPSPGLRSISTMTMPMAMTTAPLSTVAMMAGSAASGPKAVISSGMPMYPVFEKIAARPCSPCSATRFLNQKRPAKTASGRQQRAAAIGEEKRPVEDVAQRHPRHGDEEQRRQRDIVDEGVQRLAAGRAQHAEAAAEITCEDDAEDRQDDIEDSDHEHSTLTGAHWPHGAALTQRKITDKEKGPRPEARPSLQ